MIVNGDDMLETGSIWFTGCSHFGHANIIKYAKRPFVNVDHMDRELIERWNDTVRPEDTVFHLGDFAWRDHLSYAARLHGTIFQIKGNHDHGIPWETHQYVELKVGGKTVVLFHYPIQEWNGYFRGAIHAHCHIHSHEKVTGERRINVTVEAHDYAPVGLNTVLYGPEENQP